MITDERLSQLEAQVAALTARDSRRESEHVSLLNSYAEMATSREKLRQELETDYALLGRAFDQRIDELAARRQGSGGSELVTAEELREFTRFIGGHVQQALAAQLDSVLRLFDGQYRLNDLLIARLDGINSLFDATLKHLGR